MNYDDFKGLVVFSGLVAAGLVITGAFMYRRILVLEEFFERYDDETGSHSE
jgi:hypothetical protein